MSVGWSGKSSQLSPSLALAAPAKRENISQQSGPGDKNCFLWHKSTLEKVLWKYWHVFVKGISRLGLPSINITCLTVPRSYFALISIYCSIIPSSLTCRSPLFAPRWWRGLDARGFFCVASIVMKPRLSKRHRHNHAVIETLTYWNTFVIASAQTSSAITSFRFKTPLTGTS